MLVAEGQSGGGQELCLPLVGNAPRLVGGTVVFVGRASEKRQTMMVR